MVNVVVTAKNHFTFSGVEAYLCFENSGIIEAGMKYLDFEFSS